MTALAKELERAGFNANETELMTALSRYLNKGGTLQRLQELVASLSSRIKDAKVDLVGARPLPSAIRSLAPRPLSQFEIGALEADAALTSSRMTKLVEEKPYQPRVLASERVERRAKLQEIVRSRFKTSDGRHWSDITPHEANAMSRDGAEAKALLAAIPVGQPNDGKTFGDIFGVKGVDSIVEGARK